MAQTKIGWRPYVATTTVTESSLWNSIYSVYNADAVGSSSLKTSLYAAYNGESNANDSFGTNNGTAIGGLTYTTGKIGNAFQFNGSNSYIHLPENSIRFTNSFSTSFWLKTTVNQTGGGGLISDYYWGSESWGYIISLRTDNKISVFWRKDSTFNSVVSSSALSLNQWNYISVVWDKVNTNWKIYINGVLDNQLTSVNASNITYAVGSNRTNIGSINSYGPDCLNGSMDSINFWNKTLTQSEITELYNSGNGAQYITDSFYKPTTNDALNTYNGTAQGGLTYGVGKVGTAFQFNGSNSYVSLPDNSLNLTGDFTISVWIYPTAGTPQSIFNNQAYANGSIYKGWGLDINNVSGGQSGKITFTFGQGPSGGAYTGWEFRTTSLTNNAWNHVIIQRVSSVNTYCWVNGISQTYVLYGYNSNIITNPTYHTTQYNTIGASKQLSGMVSNYLANGSKVDGVTVWNRALTDDERTQIYNSGNGKQYPN